MLANGEHFDRYVVEAPLGRGGMGLVFRAYDAKLRRSVALKVLADPMGSEAHARLVREARVAASLNHPNIVAVYDVGEARGHLFMSMELVDGVQLRRHLGAAGLEPERIRWLCDIARGLDAAHAAHLVHRDVKPANIMVTKTSAKVLDFGVAKETGSGRVRHRTAPLPAMQTMPGFVVGTPRYMAPEQMLGGPLDGRADQFAWGLIACELLTGLHPRDVAAGGMWTTLPQAILSALGPAAPIVQRAVAIQPEARFPSMGEVARALEALDASSAPRISVTEHAEHTVRLSVSQAPQSDTEKTGVAGADASAAASLRPRLPISPTDTILKPLAGVAVAQLVELLGFGFRQGLLVVSRDLREGKVRFHAELVVLDETGEMVSPVPNAAVLEAVRTLIASEHREGRTWQKLAIKLLPPDQDDPPSVVFS